MHDCKLFSITEQGLAGRGSLVVPDDFDWYVFVSDESALPAIGRWIESLRPRSSPGSTK
ncbi:MAG TPA: hypothetical protein VM694_09675 [Polyangium sp.]|nr:hypothetical protein [Polyangium sp.]